MLQNIQFQINAVFVTIEQRILKKITIYTSNMKQNFFQHW